MKKLLAVLCLSSVAGAAAVFGATNDPVVRFHTGLGDIDVQLNPADAPKNVADFLYYVDNGLYTNSFIHRSVPGFVIQGGGYDVVSGQVATIPTQPAVADEYKDANVRGSLATAKTSAVNSATDEWFFNLVDNSTALGATSSQVGYAVIGHITNSQGLAVMDAIAALTVIDAGDPFSQLPVTDAATPSTVTVNDLVYVSSVTRLPALDFFDGQVAVSGGVYYLAFPSGHYFGYYEYLSDPNYIYHFDLGFEYVFDANDGKSGVYLYDFKSGTFFYTSPSFPFPFLYDFTLKSFLYYYPNPNEAGHYNTNGVRYFYDFTTGTVIQK